jgi:hypothetical protein
MPNMKAMNVCNFFHAILCCVFLSALVANAQEPSASVGGKCQSIHGLYVSAGGLLGNAAKETTFLNFIRNNGFNYLIMYDLTGMGATSTQATQLASLIKRAKNNYGVHQVGLALGSAAGANVVTAYNNVHAFDERIDVLNLEYEFWNEPDRAAAFNHSLSILQSFRQVALNNNLETEVYIGWITASEGAQLGNAVDRVLVHFYRPNDLGIIDYGIERLQYLAGANSKVRVAPIFSNEGPANTNDIPFMGAWLETHPNDQAFKTWMTGYNNLNATWKSNLEIMGASWFIYDKFLDVNVNKPNHITAHPASQTACAGETKTFSVASSAVTKNVCWMFDGQCLENGGNIAGANSSTLTVSTITSADVGSYYARVISSDTHNPTSFASNAASLSVASNCASSANLALNKPVTVSSVEVVGFEGGYAVDGNATTRWSSAYTDTQWIRIDLGEMKNIHRVKIIWEAAYGKNYTIQTSNNGTSWSNLKTITNNTQLVNDHTGLSAYARYIRIHATQRATEWGYSIHEVEVY